MAQTKPYSVKSKEFGRGPATVKRFATLTGASRYIQSHWQGADYINGSTAFHTDYSTFTLHGFTLRDIGKYRVEDGCMEFDFHDRVENV